MSVAVKNLTKTYGNQKAVNNISFELRKSEIVGFIGPNGSGKTTTMKCICGILPPDNGSIEIEGKDVYANMLTIKRMIGYLPEHNPLYTEMYVREYLNYIDGIYNKKAGRKERVDEIIELTGLTVERKKLIGQLSKGYRQRVGLAQALIHNPPVLILDEPTTGLDPNQLVEIRTMISELSADKTVLLSTHILQEVEAICDRVLIINQGEIVADGSAETIRKSKNKNEQTIYIEFNTSIKQELLEEIEGINKVQNVSVKEFLIAGNSKDDLREKIFTFATQNNITILTIRKVEETLEQAFRKLTTGK
ncbi:MAG: gliding motility-associated ABC transporter ATP-binding subunit GldA [Bacteroidales bacterium]|nr:gliding motility-associated ABC transporter ATP-binding subunit GldA [Bacteroidales bacterium]